MMRLSGLGFLLLINSVTPVEDDKDDNDDDDDAPM